MTDSPALRRSRKGRLIEAVATVGAEGFFVGGTAAVAGDWIKIEHATPDKPEVMRMADLLKVTENEILGGLLRFWLWCDYQSRDGHALGVTQAGLDRISGVTGMLGAMLDVGWLTQDEHGIHVPNYDYHLSENAKSRALAAKRKAKQRVTETSRQERDKNVTREEKRREDTNTPCSPPKKRKRATEYSADFESFWAAYPPIRKEGKGKAWDAWQKAVSIAAPAILIASAGEYASSPKGSGEYSKSPAVWLNQRCWQDDRAAWGSAGGDNRQSQPVVPRLPNDHEKANWTPYGLRSE